MYKYLKPYSIVVLVCAITCLIDQCTKRIVLQLLHIQKTEVFKVTEFLNLVAVWNKGISFGMFGGDNLNPIIFVGIAFSMIILIIWLMKNINPILQGAIIGGAFGNIIDRIMFGGVFDFIDIHAYHWHYPAFNLADSFIVFSVAVILLTKAWDKEV